MGANASKAATWIKNFQYAFSLSGGQPIIGWHTVGTTVITRGSLVLLSSGVLVAGTSGGTADQLGVIMSPGTSGAVVPVAYGHPDNVFIGQNYAATTGLTPPLGCDFATTGGYFTNSGVNTQYQRVRIIGLVPGDSTADTVDKGRVYFIIQQSQYSALAAKA